MKNQPIGLVRKIYLIKNLFGLGDGTYLPSNKEQYDSTVFIVTSKLDMALGMDEKSIKVMEETPGIEYYVYDSLY